MRNRFLFGYAIRSMLWIVSAVSLLPSVALAQVARIEIHPIESTTVTNQQFLNGDKNGKRVVIGGELRIPLGEGRFPGVILVPGLLPSYSIPSPEGESCKRTRISPNWKLFQ